MFSYPPPGSLSLINLFFLWHASALHSSSLLSHSPTFCFNACALSKAALTFPTTTRITYDSSLFLHFLLHLFLVLLHSFSVWVDQVSAYVEASKRAVKEVILCKTRAIWGGGRSLLCMKAVCLLYETFLACSSPGFKRLNAFHKTWSNVLCIKRNAYSKIAF